MINVTNLSTFSSHSLGFRDRFLSMVDLQLVGESRNVTWWMFLDHKTGCNCSKESSLTKTHPLERTQSYEGQFIS